MKNYYKYSQYYKNIGKIQLVNALTKKGASTKEVLVLLENSVINI